VGRPTDPGCARGAAGGRQSRPMAGRRILLFAVLLLLVAVGAEAIAPRDEAPRAVKGSPGATPPPPTGDVVEAKLPSERDVRAHVGDLVRLEVDHDAQDMVQIVSLGIEAPVDPGLPAGIVFDADHVGRFAVTLRDAETRVGVVEVEPEG
jgi:hypothetical protein